MSIRQRARTLLINAFGRGSRETAGATSSLANALWGLNRRDEAVVLLLESAEASGEVHSFHALALNECGRYSEALDISERALRVIEASHRTNPHLHLVLYQLATARKGLNDLAEARAVAEQSYEVLRNKPGVLRARIACFLVELLEAAGEINEARRLAREALEDARTKWRPEVADRIARDFAHLLDP